MLIVVGVLLLGALFMWFFVSQGKAERRWSVMLRKDVKDPYGLYMIHNLLAEQFPGYDFETMDADIEETLDDADSDTLSNYVFIGHNIFLDSAARMSLSHFVERGNNAFIFAQNPPEYFFEDSTWTPYSHSSYYNSSYNYYTDTSMYMSLRHSGLADSSALYKFTYNVEEDSLSRDWYYFDTYFSTEAELEIVEIGYMEGYPNMVRVPWGKGQIYFHTVPVVLTNHYLMQPTQREYAEAVLGHMHEGHIYYDDANQRPEYDYDGNRRSGGLEESALSYVLSQPALRWSLMLMLATLLAYVLFRAKRRQRIVPVLEPNTNSSLDFLQTIGRLYFLQNDHKKLASKKMRLFLSFIRGRYHISTQTLDDNLQAHIARKAQVPLDHVQEIFKKYKAIEYLDEVSDVLLIEFHSAIDRFHQTCK